MHNFLLDTLEKFHLMNTTIYWPMEHLIIRNNASNMVKAMSDGGFEDLGSFAHIVQLVIHGGIFS